MVVSWALESARGLNRRRRWGRDVALIEASPLFDRDWYLEQNPDVRKAGINPARHYLLHGPRENRNPGPNFDNRDYLTRYPDVAAGGMNPLLHFIRHGVREGRKADPGASHSIAQTLSVDGLRRVRLKEELRPLRVFSVPTETPRRVTLLTDSINRGSLFGGVGTAIIFAVLLAERLGASLRIVTQTQRAEEIAVPTVMQANGISFSGNIEFCFTDRNSAEDKEIDLRDDDCFITTSWWTTANALSAIAPQRIIYFLQEDERMFYPYGDEHLLCSEVMRSAGLRIVVNSKLLHGHLASEGFDRIEHDAPWFEPAFPQSGPNQVADATPNRKKLFMFYARPFNGRNLFLRGLEAISAALDDGLLSPEEWDFCFVGRDLTQIELPRGINPVIHESLPWPEYCALVRRVDLGLSLMYTPHPSYPPLDLAASGAVVVTNRFGPKQSLAHYSANILCVDAGIDTLVAGLAEGAELARDMPRRRANYSRNNIATDWRVNLSPVLEQLALDL